MKKDALEDEDQAEVVEEKMSQAAKNSGKKLGRVAATAVNQRIWYIRITVKT